MLQRFRDVEHLLRLAGLFLVGFLLFVLVRAALIPSGFGELGHYRTGSLEDNRKRPVVFAGRQACLDCHDDIGKALAAGRHAPVRCEACHGPLGAHASDPGASPAKRPDPVALCPVCHEQNAARPATFPQVVSREHSSGASCGDCHKPHSPSVG